MVPKEMSKSRHPQAEPESYAVRQRARDVQYSREYEAWVAAMSPEERRQLAELGVGQPQMSDISVGGYCDAADLPECATPPAAIEPETAETLETPATQPADTESVNELLRRLLGELLARDNARLSLECLSLVTGLAYTGDSMSDIARRHSVTRAAVSRRCVELSNALSLAPGRAMRPLKTRENNRNARIAQLDPHS